MDILDPRKYVPGKRREFTAQSILATFPDAGSARAAMRALKEAGYDAVQLDEVSWRPAAAGRQKDQPWPVTITGQADRDKRGLAAQDPSVGGSALGGEELVGGHHYMLTVATPDENFDRALRIIRDHGGNVDTGGPR